MTHAGNIVHSAECPTAKASRGLIPRSEVSVH